MAEIPDHFYITESSGRERVFKQMHNLRFIKIINFYKDREVGMQLLGGLDDLPRKLRLLRWDAYPLKTLPLGFRPAFLVELDMPYSEFEKLWEGIQPLGNLKWMNLSMSRNLKEIPDLSKATKLEELDLSFCKSLVEVSPSIGCLHKLSKLDMEYCIALECLPANINLKSLKVLNLRGCRSLKKFPEISHSIEELFLSHTAVEDIPESIKHLSRLLKLDMSGCSRLRNLPSTLGTVDNLFLRGKDEESSSDRTGESVTLYTDIDQSPLLIPHFGRLKHLLLTRRFYTRNGVPLQFRRLSIFPSLEDLSLCNLNMIQIPNDLCHLRCLRDLDLSGNDFEIIPACIKQLSQLRLLYLNNCQKLVSLPELPHRLEKLRLENCQELISLPELPLELKELNLKNCKKLVWLPQLPRNLQELRLGNYKKLQSFPELNNLKYLRELELSGFDFETVPISIKHFPDLKMIKLHNCKKLRSLPELPQKIKVINLHGCESLEKAFHVLLEHSPSHLLLSNCFKLFEDGEAFYQHIAYRRPRHMGICLPGSELPGWLSYKNTGDSLTIPSPPTICYASELLGMFFCVVVTFRRPQDIRGSRLRCRFGGKDFHGQGTLCATACLAVNDKSEDVYDVVSDHLFMSYHKMDRHDIERWTPFNELSFRFQVGQFYKGYEIKACGVGLLFKEEVEKEYKGLILQEHDDRLDSDCYFDFDFNFL